MKLIKKILAAAAVIIIAAAVSIVPQTTALAVPPLLPPVFAIETAQEWLEKIAADEAFKSRAAFSDGEKAASDRLVELFAGLGFEEVTPETDPKPPISVEKTKPFENRTKAQSSNVVAILGGTKAFNGDGTRNEQRVIISASIYTENDSPGVSDNGSGLAVMLALAEYFRSKPPEFSVHFVAFGGGLYGADNYAPAAFENAADRRNTLLAAHLYRIGAGDNLYLYCDEYIREHDTFLRAGAGKSNIVLGTTPANKRTFSALSVYPYSHIGMSRENMFYMRSNVNSAMLFSASWDTTAVGDIWTESKTRPNIGGTSQDTLAKIEELYPDYSDKLNGAATILIRAMEDGDFVETMLLSYSNRKDLSIFRTTFWASLITLVLVIAAAFALSFWARRIAAKNKPAPKETPPPPKVAVFGDKYE